jgi:hypothetical protein
MCMRVPRMSYETKCGKLPKISKSGFVYQEFRTDCNDNANYLRTKFYLQKTCEKIRLRLEGRLYYSVMMSMKNGTFMEFKYSQTANCAEGGSPIIRNYTLNTCHSVPLLGKIKFFQE